MRANYSPPLSPEHFFFRTLALAAIVLIQACGTSPYHPAELAQANFLERAQTRLDSGISVRAAVPDAQETLTLTGLDLYGQGIQPVWLEITNDGPVPLRAALWSIDSDYFSPIEVAYMNRSRFSEVGYEAMERWFYNNGLPRRIPPGESVSGLVFTHLKPGTKGFNFDLFSAGGSYSFTFFLALPGFTPDYARVDFSTLYAEGDIVQHDESSLQKMLGSMPCCATDAAGEAEGGPLNVVLVGSPKAMRRSLMRGGWLETSAEQQTEMAENQHRYLGRIPDGRFYRTREDGNERLMMQVWQAPWRVDESPVWFAQTYYRNLDRPIIASLRESGVLEKSELLANFVGESILADIDSAQRFVIQNFWYNQSLGKFGMVPGVGRRDAENPGETFDGYGYFTDGLRAVLFLSESPVAMDETRIIYGQGKHIRPEQRAANQ